MGGNILLRKSSVLVLPIRKSTCLRQAVRRIFQGWFKSEMGFHLAFMTLVWDVFFLEKAQQSRSTRGVSFPKVSISDHCLFSKTNDNLTSIDGDHEGSEARRLREARQPGGVSHTSLEGMQVGEIQICFRPLAKVPWQLELCWQPPLKGKESVRQERWNMFHCHPPHSINGWPSILPSATFPSGEKMEELSLML